MITIRLRSSKDSVNSGNTWNFLPSFSSFSSPSVVFFAVVLCVIPVLTTSGPLQLHTGNLHEVINNHELVFINFYADWCRFSQMLHPVFEEASNKVQKEIPTPGKIVFARVDCDNQPSLSQQYKITKYPTIKLVRFGKTLKREYRGQRSAEAFSTYIKEQLKDPIVEHNSASELTKLAKTKPVVIGYYDNKNTGLYQQYQKVASTLRDDCEFHALIGPASAEQRKTKGDHIEIHSSDGTVKPYSGSLNNYDAIYKWVTDNCIPLVREITFANAEELTEEGLPFMILFYHPEHDADVIKRFHKAAAEQLGPEKNNINCLTADGTKFTHPLHHLGKAVHDLPLLAIDSFRHMYLFNKDVKQNIDSPGALKKFYEDLQSGKLHREFHHGPDPDEPKEVEAQPPGNEPGHLPKDSTTEEQQKRQDPPTDPPESTFAKLQPSRNRYTILKDEL